MSVRLSLRGVLNPYRVVNHFPLYYILFTPFAPIHRPTDSFPDKFIILRAIIIKSSASQPPTTTTTLESFIVVASVYRLHSFTPILRFLLPFRRLWGILYYYYYFKLYLLTWGFGSVVVIPINVTVAGGCHFAAKIRENGIKALLFHVLLPPPCRVVAILYRGRKKVEKTMETTTSNKVYLQKKKRRKRKPCCCLFKG